MEWKRRKRNERMENEKEIAIRKGKGDGRKQTKRNGMKEK